MGRPIVMSSAVSSSPWGIIPAAPSGVAHFDGRGHSTRRPAAEAALAAQWAATRLSVSPSAEVIAPPPSTEVIPSAACEPLEQRACSRPAGTWRRNACALCKDPCWLLGSDAAESRCKLCTINPGRLVECQICFELTVPFELLHTPSAVAPPPAAASRVGATAAAGAAALRNAGLGRTCTGRFCKACLRTHCGVAVDSGALESPCPQPGCGGAFGEVELRRIDPTLPRRLGANRLQHGREALAARFEQDEELLSWASGRAQCCPFCFALLERSSGCNHMRCRCGKEFCYVCGLPWARSGLLATCDHACASDGAPVLSFVEEMRARRAARRAAFRAGLHARAGAASAVRLLPLDLVRKIEEMV